MTPVPDIFCRISTGGGCCWAASGAVALSAAYLLAGRRFMDVRRVRLAADAFFGLLLVRAVHHGLSEMGWACALGGRNVHAMLDTMLLTSLVAASALGADWLFWDVWLTRSTRAKLPLILTDILRVALVLALLMLGLKVVFGYSVTGLFATSAVLSAILGFALQDMLGNIIAGIALQIERPFECGDWVTVGQYCGQVQSMSWRATRIRDLAGNLLVVPNSQISKESIINHHKPTPEHALVLPIGLDYAHPPFRVKETVLAAVAQTPNVLTNPAPKVLLVGYGDSAIQYEIKIWIRDHAIWKDIIDDLYTRLWYQFRREGLRIPFPIRSVQWARQKDLEADATAREQAVSVAALRAVPLLAVLDAEQIRRLADNCPIRLYGRAETVIREGESGDSLFVLVDGRLEVLIRGGRVNTLEAGAVFGEMSLLTGQTRSATIATLEASTLIEIRREQMKSVFDADPTAVERLGRLLSEHQEASARSMEQRAQDEAAAAASGRGASEREQSLVRRIKSFFGLAG